MERNGFSDPNEYKSKLESSWEWARTATNVYINCWHMNDGESDGMWKLYGDISSSVCIQSTFERLYECTGDNCNIGIVKYADYQTAEISPTNLFNLYLHKRTSFSHEQEIRAILSEPGQPKKPGILHSVDLHSLIESIYLPPKSRWFGDLVEKVLKTYKLDVEIQRSLLEVEPGHFPSFVFDDELRRLAKTTSPKRSGA